MIQEFKEYAMENYWLSCDKHFSKHFSKVASVRESSQNLSAVSGWCRYEWSSGHVSFCYIAGSHRIKVEELFWKGQTILNFYV